MKKKYASPRIELEAFQLDAAIAGSCAINMHQTAETHCMVDIYFANYCEEDMTIDWEKDPYCYHGPLGMGSFIAS